MQIKCHECGSKYDWRAQCPNTLFFGYIKGNCTYFYRTHLIDRGVAELIKLAESKNEPVCDTYTTT